MPSRIGTLAPTVLITAAAAALLMAFSSVTSTEATFADTAAAQTQLSVQAARDVVFTEISAGVDHTLAATTDGDVYAWGLNSVGQLGLGSTGGSVQSPTRVPMPVDDDIVAVGAGRNVSIALGMSGNVYTWGDTVAAASGATPALVAGLGGHVTGVSAGGLFFLAWTDGGQLYSWGDNGSGRLGRGQADVADLIPGLVQAAGVSTGIVGADAGRFGGVAWKDSGSVYAWGASQGAVDGVTIAGVPAGPIRQIEQGETTKLLLMESGAVWYSLSAAGFVTQTGVSGVVEVSASIADSHDSESFLALDGAGAVFAWWENNSGQYGDGTTSKSETPRRIALTPAGNPAIAGVSAGDNHSVLRTVDGRHLASGADQYGQLGNGDLAATKAYLPPVPIVLWP